jgi:hypothetical protein
MPGVQHKSSAGIQQIIKRFLCRRRLNLRMIAAIVNLRDLPAWGKVMDSWNLEGAISTNVLSGLDDWSSSVANEGRTQVKHERTQYVTPAMTGANGRLAFLASLRDSLFGFISMWSLR